jgi:hypothetical protein
MAALAPASGQWLAVCFVIQLCGRNKRQFFALETYKSVALCERQLPSGANPEGFGVAQAARQGQTGARRIASTCCCATRSCAACIRQGALLPGELRLAEIHGVSAASPMRRALDAAGGGWADRPARPALAPSGVTRGHAPGAITADFATLMPQVVRMGQTTTARLLSFAYVAPRPHRGGNAGHMTRMQRRCGCG